MKKLFIAALPLMAATPVAAQDVEGIVSIDGSVAGRCLFTTASAIISLGELAQGTGSTAGQLDTSKVDAKSATLEGWCNNAAAEMSVEAFALENDADDAAGFTNLVNFVATAAAGEAQASDDSADEGEGEATTIGLYNGEIVVTLDDSDAGSDILVAGDYDGSVVVTLSPKFVVAEQES